MFYHIIIITLLLCILFYKVSRSGKLHVTHSILPCLDALTQTPIPLEKLGKSQQEDIISLQERAPEKLRIATYNILFNAKDHQLDKSYRWKSRLPRITKLVMTIGADILCVQELLENQVKGLSSQIDPHYQYFGMGGTSCRTICESNGIFFRTERLQLQQGKTYFISETPDVMSADPFGEVQTLIVCHFTDKKTGNALAVLNTHFSFYNANSREYSARFIVDFVKDMGDVPVLLTGDFNSFPFRPDLSLPYYDGNIIDLILSDSSILSESMNIAKFGHVGPIASYTNVPESIISEPFQGTGTSGVILDHIYVGNGVTVIGHAIEPAKVDGHFPSDHMPVIADFCL